jgi:outer membrane protein
MGFGMQFDKAKQMMKRILFLVLTLAVGSLYAQKSKDIGFVDSDVILGKMPEYRAAQKDLDDLGAKYQAEAQQLQTALEQMHRDFQAEEILLTSDQRRQKKEAIASKEAELIQYRESKFGPTGELYQERARLIKPLQDKVYDAIQNVAKKEGYAYIFDKSGGALMLYADQKFDKTLEVMEALGIPTEDMPGAQVAPAKPNTQNRLNAPAPNAGNGNSGAADNDNN